MHPQAAPPNTAQQTWRGTQELASLPGRRCRPGRHLATSHPGKGGGSAGTPATPAGIRSLPSPSWKSFMQAKRLPSCPEACLDCFIHAGQTRACLSAIGEAVCGVGVREEESPVHVGAKRIEHGAVLERHIQRLDGILRDVWASHATASHQMSWLAMLLVCFTSGIGTACWPGCQSFGSGTYWTNSRRARMSTFAAHLILTSYSFSRLLNSSWILTYISQSSL